MVCVVLALLECQVVTEESDLVDLLVGVLITHVSAFTCVVQPIVET